MLASELLMLMLLYTFVYGSLYLLLSLGFSLICGVLRVFHLGYAYIYLIALYVTWAIADKLGLGLISGIIGMLAVNTAMALAVYHGIIKRYRRSEDLMLTSLLLVAIIAQELLNYLCPEGIGVSLPTRIAPAGALWGVVDPQLLASAVAAVAFTAVFVFIFTKTRLGLAMRAVSQSTYVSEVLGIDVEKIYSLAVVVATIPAAVAMLFLAPVIMIAPSVGFSYFMYAIAVVVLGGLGALKGTLVASYVVSAIGAVATFVLGQHLLAGAIILGFIIVMLVLKPGGLFRGERLW